MTLTIPKEANNFYPPHNNNHCRLDKAHTFILFRYDTVGVVSGFLAQNLTS